MMISALPSSIIGKYRAIRRLWCHYIGDKIAARYFKCTLCCPSSSMAEPRVRIIRRHRRRYSLRRFIGRALRKPSSRAELPISVCRKMPSRIAMARRHDKRILYIAKAFLSVYNHQMLSYTKRKWLPHATMSALCFYFGGNQLSIKKVAGGEGIMFHRRRACANIMSWLPNNARQFQAQYWAWHW